MDGMTRPPDEQWWAINGSDIMSALHRAYDGEDPDLIYLELIANSDAEDYGQENS